MLKIYDLIYSVSIDGGPWKRLEDPFDINWFVADVVDEDVPETELLLDDVSFQEAYDYLPGLFSKVSHNFRCYISTPATENILKSAKCFRFARRTNFARMQHLTGF